jgi:glucokinase
MAEEYLESDKPTLLRDLVNADDCRIAGEDIAKAAQLGDQAAIEMIMTAGRYFGYGLSTIIQVLNPDCIVIGGGLVNIGPILLDPCMEAMNQNIHPVLVGSAKIALSELWNDAGMIGAGALVWEQMG